MSNPNVRFINKTKMREVNRALKAAGYVAYPGDSTTAEPKGCGSGYVANLVNHIAGGDPAEQRKVREIVVNVLDIGN